MDILSIRPMIGIMGHENTIPCMIIWFKILDSFKTILVCTFRKGVGYCLSDPLNSWWGIYSESAHVKTNRSLSHLKSPHVFEAFTFLTVRHVCTCDADSPVAGFLLICLSVCLCTSVCVCVCPAFQPCATEPAISQRISCCAAVSCWWGTLNNVISPLLFEIKASISWTSAPSPPSQWPSPPAHTLSTTYSVHNKDAAHWQTTLDVKQSQSIACFLCENTIGYGLPLKR